MTTRFVFGYGSLVNLGTHAYRPAFPARLLGWQRVWGKRYAARGITSLSVTRADAAETEGMIVAVPEAAWPDLDAREAGYACIPLRAEEIFHTGPANAQIFTYAAPEVQTANAAHPILASYLDVVLQGFAQLGGADAQAGFISSTTGWGDTLLDDRHAPRYPRATPITPQEQAAIDLRLPPLTRVPPRS